MKLCKNLIENEASLKKELISEDITFMPLKINSSSAILIFGNEIVDKALIGELILKPLSEFCDNVNKNSLFNVFLFPEKKEVETTDEVIEEVVMGNAVLISDGIDCAFSFGIKKFESRSITEPPTSTVIKGPREGFVESLPLNISLIRKKIKSEKLRFENLKVGKYSQTQVCVCYIDGIADKELIKNIKCKLEKINIDAILDSSYVSKFLGEHTASIFKQIGNTEKPDILAGKILEGRVAVLVDGSPIALTAPYLLIEDFQSASDYYNSNYSATVARIIRILSVLISVYLPALFVSAELFHLQLIPLSFLLTIVNSIKGIPLSPSYEMFFTLLIFEILNEASVRMPKYVGMVVSIVGGLVLGETAVSAGIISAPTLMIVALSGICLYTVPELEQTFALIRILFIMVAGSFGAYGLLIASAIIFLYLITFENYSIPLCAPFSPLVPQDLKDGFKKDFLLHNTRRPLSLKNKNKTRLKVEEGERICKKP